MGSSSFIIPAFPPPAIDDMHTKYHIAYDK